VHRCEEVFWYCILQAHLIYVYPCAQIRIHVQISENSPGVGRDHSKTIVKSGPLCSSQLVQRSRYVDDGKNPLCATASSGTRRAIRAISRRSRVLRYLITLAASLLRGKVYNELSTRPHPSIRRSPQSRGAGRTSLGNTSLCHFR
jgi:hypothetical protein